MAPTQGYPRSGYQTNSTILPPLQQNRNGTARVPFDQPSPTTTPILPSQMAPEGDRYGTAAGSAAFDPTGSANGTPR